jgi:hypothetical protein
VDDQGPLQIALKSGVLSDVNDTLNKENAIILLYPSRSGFGVVGGEVFVSRSIALTERLARLGIVLTPHIDRPYHLQELQ